MGGPENGNFPILYVMKMSLRRELVALKSLKTPLRKVKMAPNLSWDFFVYFDFQTKIHFEEIKKLRI